MMRTARIVLLGTVFLAVAAAQGTPETLAALDQASRKAEADWIALARDLDARVARMLPCDPRAAAAIQEVNQASTSRLNALAQYLQALIAGAAAETQAARRMVQAGQAALGETSGERIDTEQERAGIESQILNLAVAASQRPALSGALEQLKQIEALVKERAEWAAQQATSGDQAAKALNELLAAYQKREDALRSQASAFETERARWSAYYTARAERARLECSITGGGR
jgi:hypothetical protein